MLGLLNTESLSGGSGLNDSIPDVLRELQGLSVAVFAGVAANVKSNVPFIRKEDTILAALVIGTTTPSFTDDTANFSISENRAGGTITIVSAVDGNLIVLNGVTITFKTSPSPTNPAQVAIGATDTASAVNLAAAINKLCPVVATSAAGVVTVRALPGSTTTRNPTALSTITSSNGTRLAVSQTTNSGGTLTVAAAADGDTFSVLGTTFRFKTTPLLQQGNGGINDITLAGVDNTDATAARAKVTAVLGAARVSVSGATNVVIMFTPADDATAGNAITLTRTGSPLTLGGGATGGVLGGGTNTGGVQSTTDNSAAGNKVLLFWYDKVKSVV